MWQRPCECPEPHISAFQKGWNVQWRLPWLPLARILKCFLNSYIKFFIPEITWNSFCCALQILTDMPIKVPYINRLLFCHVRILEAGLFWGWLFQGPDDIVRDPVLYFFQHHPQDHWHFVLDWLLSSLALQDLDGRALVNTHHPASEKHFSTSLTLILRTKGNYNQMPARCRSCATVYFRTILSNRSAYVKENKSTC